MPTIVSLLKYHQPWKLVLHMAWFCMDLVDVVLKSYVNVWKRNISEHWWNTHYAMIYGLSLLNPHVLTLGTNSRLKLYHVIKHSNTLIFVLFCSLRNPFLHFLKAPLFVVLVWNVVIFWILHKKRCFGFATYVWLNGFSSKSVKTIIQSWSSCNKSSKPSPKDLAPKYFTWFF